MAYECPSNSRRKEDDREWKPAVVKKEVLDREMPIAEEEESETEPSTYRPVPSIRVPVKVKETLWSDVRAARNFLIHKRSESTRLKILDSVTAI